MLTIIGKAKQKVYSGEKAKFAAGFQSREGVLKTLDVVWLFEQGKIPVVVRV